MGFKLTQEEYMDLRAFQENTGGDIKKILMEALGEFYQKQSRTKASSKKGSTK